MFKSDIRHEEVALFFHRFPTSAEGCGTILTDMPLKPASVAACNLLLLHFTATDLEAPPIVLVMLDNFVSADLLLFASPFLHGRRKGPWSWASTTSKPHRYVMVFWLSFRIHFHVELPLSPTWRCG